MFLVIALMALFHWMMAVCWFIFKKITVVNDYTSENKEFVRCEYPVSKHIRYNI